MSRNRVAFQASAICLIAGAIAVFVFRLAHGDLPAGDAPAALAFIAGYSAYTAVHLGTVLGVVVWVGGLVLLASSLSDGAASWLGWLGVASALIGAAVFCVDFSIDGFAGRALATRWLTATPAGRADLELAATTAFQMLGGTSLTSIAILWGVPLVLFGLAVKREHDWRWLAWSGVIVGGATFLGACAQYVLPDVVPGVWIYGGLVSLVQLWSVALGFAMWRSAV